MNETLHSLERQVVRQERLAAVGVLVSGVAHELNNPLQAILGTAELLERQPDLSPAALDEIAFLKTQSGRAREIIRNLSRFSSQQSGPPSPVDLRDVIGRGRPAPAPRSRRSGIVLDVETTSSRKVQANFTELEQVTLNFVINAQQSIEASPSGRGRIIVRVRDEGRAGEARGARQRRRRRSRPTSRSCSSRSSRPSRSARAPASDCPSATASSTRTAARIGYARNAWGGATFFFELPAVEPGDPRHDPSAVLHRSV